jgi:crotonobetainyl-CoA:carnitine CoA-transferase CaiB-like acyl-CoA transferase
VLDVGTNFMWPDTMSLTAEMLVEKDPSSYVGKASRRPPQSLMATKDGYGVLMLWPEAPHFEHCLKAFFPEFVDDARYADIPARINSFRAFQALLAERFATLTNAELMQFFGDNDLPGNVVIDLSEIHNDPQVLHNGLLVEHEVGSMGLIREPRPAPLMSETPLRVGGAAPRRGADTRAVLTGLGGFTEADLRELAEDGGFGKFVPE